MTKHKNGKKLLSQKQFKYEKDKDIKEEFLSPFRQNNLKPSTAKTVRSILFKVDEYENQIDKSIYDFSLEERDDFITSMFPNKSRDVVNVTRSYLVGYVNYCIDNNLVRHMENRFSLISIDDVDKYVNTVAVKMKYLSKEEIREAQDKLVNNCDKLMLRLIPLSIRGRTEEGNTNEELINLRVKDAIESYETHKLKVWNNDADYRYVEINDEIVDLLKKTIADDRYTINNGSQYSKKGHNKIAGRGIGNKSFPLNDTDYVFRTSGNKHGKVRVNFFNLRINSFKKWIGNPYITITNLYNSGIIDYAIQLKNEKGAELDNDDYNNIIEKFTYGNPQISQDGSEDWSVPIAKIKSMVKDYIELKS